MRRVLGACTCGEEVHAGERRAAGEAHLILAPQLRRVACGSSVFEMVSTNTSRMCSSTSPISLAAKRSLYHIIIEARVACIIGPARRGCVCVSVCAWVDVCVCGCVRARAYVCVGGGRSRRGLPT